MSKLITITGNSGKTVFSFLLANELAQKGKKAIVISTDNQIPSFHYLMPIDKKIENKSLGKILALAVINTKSILDNMITFKRNENLGVLCYSVDESVNTYPQILESNIEALILQLKSLVDYIIVDTQTYRNIIDQYAVKNSDNHICITTADYKGYAYRKRYDDELTTHILYNNNAYNPLEDIKRTFKLQVKYIMPYFKQLSYIYNGSKLEDISVPQKYDKLISNIIKEININE